MNAHEQYLIFMKHLNKAAIQTFFRLFHFLHIRFGALGSNGYWCYLTCTSLTELSVGMAPLSASGPDSVQISRRIISIVRHLHRMQQLYLSRPQSGCLPKLLSRSSGNCRPPETPFSLDWSCTVILSLLLIRHTEVLEFMKRNNECNTAGRRMW